MLVARLVTVTDAPGTTACCSSSTVPSKRPVCSCAESGALASKQNATRPTPAGHLILMVLLLDHTQSGSERRMVQAGRQQEFSLGAHGPRCDAQDEESRRSWSLMTSGSFRTLLANSRRRGTQRTERDSRSLLPKMLTS